MYSKANPVVNSRNGTTKTLLLLLVLLSISMSGWSQTGTPKKYFIDDKSSYYINRETWVDAPNGGDTIFISSERTKALRFQFITGDQNNPVVVINYGGQVKIDGGVTWGAIVFENCRYIKISGEGNEQYKYGFQLAADKCGLAFAELSSDCEAANIKISHDGFFGIMAKKDYSGNPPNPIPVFANLVIHDCFIENVTEGMYLGETKSPGMEFKHVRIYNNIVRNTGRESIQIANMVEDVEIYHNTLLNAGIDNLDQQNNLLQIGDNSVAKVYENIMMDAPGCGIISFGKGDNIFSRNYIASCKGIFLDNRKFTNDSAPIRINNNFFTNNVDKGWIIRNMNQINFLYISDNIWDTDINFYKNDSGNNENYSLKSNMFSMIAPLLFTDPQNNDYSKAAGNPSAYDNLGAPGGPEYLTKDGSVTLKGVPVQIKLSADMIVDEVLGGSYWSASYLVDEQYCTPENGMHPIGQSWKPYWNMDKGPYHIYIDLGKVYTLTTVAFHDMHNTKNLEVSVGEPGKWEHLFTEPCDKYNTWKENSMLVNTRYVRLSMEESVFAAINEMVMYGYPADGQALTLKSGEVIGTNITLGELLDNNSSLYETIKLNQNLVYDRLGIILPDDQAHDFTIEIFNLNGFKVLHKEFVHNISSRVLINVSRECCKSGVYILRYYNSEGITKSMKFIKRDAK